MRGPFGKLHEKVMALVDGAEELVRQGDEAGACAKYVEAAQLEERVVASVPATRPRTRGILSRAAVSLWLCARRREDAVRLAEQYLAGSLLPGFARELRALVEEK